MNNFEYIIPKSAGDVVTQLKTKSTVIKAGGVDLLDMMKEGLAVPERLINLGALTDLQYVRRSGGRLRIGPLTLLDDLAGHRELQGPYDALMQAADGAATPQIRNMATLGGNLCQRPRCWYFRSNEFDCTRKGGKQCFAINGENQYHAIFGNQDGCVIVHPSATAVALMALDAQLTLLTESGEKTVSIADFFVTPSQDIEKENILTGRELITEISVPEYGSDVKSFYFKQKEKQSFDWPIAEVAVLLRMDGKTCKDARIVLGAAAPTPWRVKDAENFIKGKTITTETARQAATEAMKNATPLDKNEYKVSVFKAVIMRTLCWAVGIDPLKG